MLNEGLSALIETTIRLCHYGRAGLFYLLKGSESIFWNNTITIKQGFIWMFIRENHFSNAKLEEEYLRGLNLAMSFGKELDLLLENCKTHDP